MIRCTAARQTPAVCFSVTHCPRNRLDGAVTAVTVLGWSRDCCHCCIVPETSTGGPPMTASYRIGVCGSPQCPRSCGRTGAARQGRLQLYPMAHTLGGNAALHHTRMPATDGCIRVIATMLGASRFPAAPTSVSQCGKQWICTQQLRALPRTYAPWIWMDIVRGGNGIVDRTGERMDAQYTVERFVDYLRVAKGLSEHTVAAYRSDVLQCLDALAASPRSVVR